jgi:hypothetical protein
MPAVSDGGPTSVIMALNSRNCHAVVFQVVLFAVLFSRLLYHAGKTSRPICSAVSGKLLIYLLQLL